MAHFWRLVKQRRLACAFDGEGAKRFGGRWNSRGYSMVYCSQHLSLAALEILVHMEVEDFGGAYLSIHCQVPDDLKIPVVNVSQLPVNWRDIPGPSPLTAMGNQWIAGRQSLLLAVPSVVIPQESNILINPQHSDFEKIQFGPPTSFGLDSRLIRPLADP